MEPSLFSFIWRYSKRQQLGLLLLTLLTFPFLYATLELPKRIVNDAIGAPLPQVEAWGWVFTPEEFLLVLCLAFLAAVLTSGAMKMQLNTLKGVLSERLLRRLRYQLIARMMRFPAPYFRTTSQGEMVSMITAESEPMGGLMGDAVAQPVFQAGQMLTIVSFLFAQSVWFGLASVALIPLQAWLIPMLQRQINLLNKDRIAEVRALSAEIGETAAGLSDLRTNGGWRFRLAEISERLGRLFEIRRRIYMKKFFMKFLNNLIGHLTPFFFYSVGGLLAIRGEITVGALVAALTAYKDLSAPWKELLAYYNQVQDMSLRWQVMAEKFAPSQMIASTLFEGEPVEIPHLRGPIELRDVTVRDSLGNPVLDRLSLTIPAGAQVAIRSSSDAERAAFAQLITREVIPSEGEVIIDGRPLARMHQEVIAARIGYAYSTPYLFDGSLGNNVLMPLRRRPRRGHGSTGPSAKQQEALRAGNTADLVDADWSNPDLVGLSSEDSLRDWWFQLIQAMGVDGQLFHRTLHMRLHETYRALETQITALRATVEGRLQDAGLRDIVYRFQFDLYNPALPLAENMMFALPVKPVPETLYTDPDGPFQRVLRAEGLAEQAGDISLNVLKTLKRTFGRGETTHPLFLRLGLDSALYLRIADAAERLERGYVLSDQDRALLCTLPFLLSEEQIGLRLPKDFKAAVLRIRDQRCDLLLAACGGVFRRLKPEEYARKLTVLENALFGRISAGAGAKAQAVEDVVADVMADHDLKSRLALMIYDLPTGLGGTLLEPVFRERASFTRAAIKRPDILILDRALASHDADNRLRTRARLQELLPKTTMIHMEENFENPSRYDLYVELKDGRIGATPKSAPGLFEVGEASADFDRKIDMIRSVDLFSRLDARNQRLLAFSANQVSVPAGSYVFRAGERGDAVYLCLSGQAELRFPQDGSSLGSVAPGRLIGDLSVILDTPRQLDLIARDDCMVLRIGAEEFRSVFESDITVSVQLLQTVSGHLSEAANALQEARAANEQLLPGLKGKEI